MQFIPSFGSSFRLVIFLSTLFSHFAFSATAEDFKVQGRLGLGVQKVTDEDLETRFEGRLQAISPRKKGFQAIFEISADETSRSLEIKDAYADYQNENKSNRVRFGRGKKVLGWEWEYPTSTRLTLSRTATYQYLNERALTGRDYFVSFAHLIANESESVNPPEDDQFGDLKIHTDTTYFRANHLIDASELWKFEFAAHLNEANDASLIVSAIRTFSPHWRVGAWLMGQRTQSVTQIIGVWEATLSALYETGVNRFSLEGFAGTDPYRSDINRVYADGKMVNFLSVRGEYGLYLSQWNPYGSVDHLWRDSSQMASHDTEGKLGLRYFFIPEFSLAAEGSVRANLVRNDVTSFSSHENSFELLGRAFF